MQGMGAVLISSIGRAHAWRLPLKGARLAMSTSGADRRWRAWIWLPGQGRGAPLKAPETKTRRMFAGNERRQRDQSELSRFLRPERPRGRAVLSARADQRPDPDVHQCRHGAVQE